MRRERLLAKLALAAAHEAAGQPLEASATWIDVLGEAQRIEREPGPLQAEALFGLARLDLAATRPAQALLRLQLAAEIWRAHGTGAAVLERVETGTQRCGARQLFSSAKVKRWWRCWRHGAAIGAADRTPEQLTAGCAPGGRE